MGQGTVTLTTFEERAALEFALGGLPPNPVINSATLTLFIPVAPLVLNDAQVHGYAGDGVIMVPDLTVANLLTDFQVGAAGSVVIPLDPSFIQDLVTANEAFAGFMLRNVTAASGVFTIWTVDSGFDQFNPVLELDVEESQVIPGAGHARAPRHSARCPWRAAGVAPAAHVLASPPVRTIGPITSATCARSPFLRSLNRRSRAD